MKIKMKECRVVVHKLSDAAVKRGWHAEMNLIQTPSVVCRVESDAVKASGSFILPEKVGGNIKAEPKYEEQDITVKKEPEYEGEDITAKQEPEYEGGDVTVKEKPAHEEEHVTVKEEPKYDEMDISVKEEPEYEGEDIIVKEEPEYEGEDITVKEEPEYEENDLTMKKQQHEYEGDQITVKQEPKYEAEDITVKQEPTYEEMDISVKEEPEYEGEDVTVKEEPIGIEIEAQQALSPSSHVASKMEAQVKASDAQAARQLLSLAPAVPDMLGKKKEQPASEIDSVNHAGSVNASAASCSQEHTNRLTYSQRRFADAVVTTCSIRQNEE
ncbi:zinc metalloprotease ZmpC-like [Hyalella azteca]|uniref:Zinc metalloprotease ZmpC-like n=1 Tax=Hyalella azteca TaxID=294128 RepID=A0A8B7NL77_HYAAZ|nr:zinc metalloprotease ZmpC-like [Hyalella azteca]